MHNDALSPLDMSKLHGTLSQHLAVAPSSCFLSSAVAVMMERCIVCTGQADNHVFTELVCLDGLCVYSFARHTPLTEQLQPGLCKHAPL